MRPGAFIYIYIKYQPPIYKCSRVKREAFSFLDFKFLSPAVVSQDHPCHSDYNTTSKPYGEKLQRLEMTM
uniref:Uncharacterized protein MANES_15G157300 n=1 Tax=Rhizophora mucronata TaxID=61149 RepID=A0A2P2PKJ1_RHIMU